MFKIKIRLFAILLGTALLLCSCADSSSDTGSSNTNSSSLSESVTTTSVQSSQNEVSSTTTQTSAATSQQTEATTEAVTTTSQADTKPDAVPEGVPMWECTDKNGNTMIFLGSMHAAKPDFYPIPEKIKKAYDEAEVVAFECDADAAESEDAQFELRKKMSSTDGVQLKDKLSPEAYEILCKRLADYDMSGEMLAGFRPWAAYETLSALKITSGEISNSNGIDYYLMKQTKADKKQLFELESYQTQIDMVTDQPDKLYDALLRLMKNETVQSYNGETARLYTAWLKGDLDTLEKMLLPSDEEYRQEGMSDEDIRLIRERDRVQVDNRNLAMAAKIKGLFAGGKKTLVVVGSAHFLGANGIISLLGKDGFSFKRI